MSEVQSECMNPNNYTFVASFPTMIAESCYKYFALQEPYVKTDVL
jgi:hypothetical protein